MEESSAGAFEFMEMHFETVLSQRLNEVQESCAFYDLKLEHCPEGAMRLAAKAAVGMLVSEAAKGIRNKNAPVEMSSHELSSD